MDKIQPFLKWAGGKRSLWKDISSFLPEGLGTSITTYVEPFLGGGAVFFGLSQKLSFREVYLSDINAKLVVAYKCIQRWPEEVYYSLLSLVVEYESYNKIEGKAMSSKEDMYYRIRDIFNRSRVEESAEFASMFIFLNRTAFNGLYRENSKKEFNAPFGRYKHIVCSRSLLEDCSRALDRAALFISDFEAVCRGIRGFDKAFVYLDPPYRTTDGFTEYSGRKFDDSEQRRVAKVFSFLDANGAKVMCSNADLGDGFIERKFSKYRIEKVKCRTSISRSGESRGLRNEVLIMNY